MKEPSDIVKAIPVAVVEKAYSDAVAETLKEVSKIGVDAVKIIRLALFPLQFGAALQDRLAQYIDRAVRMIPEEQRVPPVESIALQVAERLRLQEDGSVITAMYINLLARAMDKERLGEAHPAFVNLISQLAPDEVSLLEQLSEAPFKMYCADVKRIRPIPAEEREAMIARSAFPNELKERTRRIQIQPERLAQPELIHTFIEHLVSLGIARYSNEPTNEGDYKGQRQAPGEVRYWFIELSQFGRLFHTACVKKDRIG